MNLTDLIKTEFAGKSITLLQGPTGSFFAKLARKLRAHGAVVEKINFNGGDFFFYPRGRRCAVSSQRLGEFYEGFFTRQGTQILIMYNDCRPIHQAAIAVAKRLGLAVWIFEEGYLRPNHITLERGGVNANSSLPREAEFYLKFASGAGASAVRVSGAAGAGGVGQGRAAAAGGAGAGQGGDDPVAEASKAPKRSQISSSGQTRSFPRSFRAKVGQTFLYWFFAFILAPFFNNSLHHRSLNPFEFIYWLRSPLRKLIYKFTERSTNRKIAGLKNKYFLAILQVFNDTQIRHHYRHSIEDFIAELILSFANHARAKSYLVFKHHPMDRGYKNYSALIKRLSEKYRVEGRILYVHDSHLPGLLHNAQGCITINSTVGLSAIFHGCALAVCGDAFYKIPGLSYPKKLQFFWQDARAHRPDPALIKAFEAYLIAHNQINGNFYENDFLEGLGGGG